MSLSLSIQGMNSRFYHAFKCEDFVGRISDLASVVNKLKLEEAILPRFYMGFPGCIDVRSKSDNDGMEERMIA